jgi:hypothetical protein
MIKYLVSAMQGGLNGVKPNLPPGDIYGFSEAVIDLFQWNQAVNNAIWETGREPDVRGGA